MSLWSEIRPPNPSADRDQGGHPRSNWSLRRAVGFVPLGLALVAASAGLALVANQQSTSEQPLVVESVNLPTIPAPNLIDLNTATVAELATLPGIGETRARAIVASRERARFIALVDLAERGILRPSQLPAIADQATVYVTLE